LQNKILVQGGRLAKIIASKPARRLAKPLCANKKNISLNMMQLKTI